MADAVDKDGKPICRQAPHPQRNDEDDDELESPRVLSRADILGQDDLPKVLVVVPEWGGAAVYVRTMTGVERDGYEELIQNARQGPDRFNLQGVRVELLVRVLCDAGGQPLFTAEDRDALNGKSAAALDRLFVVAQRLSGLSADDVEELAGNSPGDLSDSSGSS